jgi:hypothetical protein
MCRMITAKQVRDLIAANPFKPFRIYMSDGSRHEVTLRDMAIVERNVVDIGLNLDPDDIAEGLVRCSILHIVNLEDIEAGIARCTLLPRHKLLQPLFGQQQPLILQLLPRDAVATGQFDVGRHETVVVA